MHLGDLRWIDLFTSSENAVLHFKPDNILLRKIALSHIEGNYWSYEYLKPLTVFFNTKGIALPKEEIKLYTEYWVVSEFKIILDIHCWTSLAKWFPKVVKSSTPVQLIYRWICFNVMTSIIKLHFKHLVPYVSICFTRWDKRWVFLKQWFGTIPAQCIGVSH